MQRPSATLVESAYNALFHSQSFDKLVDAALDGRLFSEQRGKEDVVGRSMAWKLFLLPQPPLTTSLGHANPPLEALSSSREHYVSLLREKMKAPDGSYEKGLEIFGDSMSSSSLPQRMDDLELNNPLSLDSSNPWHAYFSAIESRNVIRQDVERAFPDLPYFRSTRVQDEMTNILFLHSTERDSVGYRQGMHELLACIYRVVDYDSIESSDHVSSPEIQRFCDRTYVAGDAFTLFSHMMRRIELWYEWRSPEVLETSQNIPHFSSDGELISSARGQLKPYIAPIIPISASIRDNQLNAVDPHLCEKLQEGNVEPQMYMIRWLRLLFTREFPVAESMVLWDGLFASVATEVPSPSTSSASTGIALASWICIAMLIRIRNILIPGDYTTQLTNLLRYPSFAIVDASKALNAPELLLRQAQHLMNTPTPATGVSLMMQNRTELNIPVDIPRNSVSQLTSSRSHNTSLLSPPSRVSHNRDKYGIQETIANRLMDANEAIGIQRGLLNTISEIRKTLPELSQSFLRGVPWNNGSMTPPESLQPAARNNDASSAPEIRERPPWEPRTRLEVETEVAELHALLKTLSSAIGWAVDVLLLDEEETKETKQSLKDRKQEAIECMAYVRDVLAQGGKGEIEEERLMSADEYKRRKQPIIRSELLAPRLPKPVIHSPAPPDSKAEDKIQVKPLTYPPKQDRFTPRPNLPRTLHISSSSSPDIVARFSSQTGLLPTAQSSPTTVEASPRRIMPPWEHTPSNFSEGSPYAGAAVLPRPPPPSSSGSVPVKIPSPNQKPSLILPENIDSDPLGVIK